jgi:hypothetical protein
VTALFTPDLLKADSWDAVLDSAYDRTREKFVGENKRPPRKTLSKILKSMLTNRTVLDENANEIARHLGQLSEDLAHFYPLYSFLNRACSWLRCDPHFPHVLKLARQFGVNPILRPFYAKMCEFPSGHELFQFDLNVSSQLITLRKLT